MNETNDKLARDINSRIMNSSSVMYALTRPHMPEWYGHLIAELVVAVGEREMRFVGAENEAESEAAGTNRIRLIVLTDDLIVTADVSDTSAGSAELPSTVARSRRELRALEVGSELGVVHSEGYRDWPGRLRLVLTYPDTEVTLPGSATTGGDELEAVAALVPSLVDDLGGSARPR